MPRVYFVDRGKFNRSDVYGCYDGYSYHLNNTARNATLAVTTLYLRCSAYYLKNCHGTARIVEANGQSSWLDGNVHCCERNYRSHQVRLLKTEIIEACRSNPYEPPRQVLNRIGARYPVDILASVRLSRVRYAMRRARAAMYPNIPNSLEDLANLLRHPDYQRLTETVGGTDCLFSGLVGPPGEQSIVFISSRFLDVLRMVRRVMADATFNSTPASPPASQVYQIVTILRNNMIPLLVAIMQRKTRVAYEAILVHLKERAPQFQPAEVMLDFEYAAFMAWVNQYPNAAVSGCYIHQVRAVLDNAKDFGLRPVMEYDDEDEDVISSIVKASLAIPLLPHMLLQRGLDTLILLAESCGVLHDLEPFFGYYQRTWLTGWRFECVSVFQLAHRTNNACESAHRLLRLATGPLHPSIWTFLDGLKLYENNAFSDVMAFVDGRSFGASRRVAVILNDEAIRNFTHDLMDGSISIRTFLLKASHRVATYVQENF